MITLSWPNVQDFATLNNQMRALTTTLRRFSPLDSYFFYENDVPANQTDINLSVGGGALDAYLVLRDAHVHAIGAYVTEPRTSGSLVVEPEINGTTFGESLTLDASNTQSNIVRIDRSIDSFIPAGSRLGMIISSTSWAPTTADLVAAILIQYTMED